MRKLLVDALLVSAIAALVAAFAIITGVWTIVVWSVTGP